MRKGKRSYLRKYSGDIDYGVQHTGSNLSIPYFGLITWNRDYYNVGDVNESKRLQWEYRAHLGFYRSIPSTRSDISRICEWSYRHWQRKLFCVISMVLRLEDIEKSPLSKPREEVNGICELRQKIANRSIDKPIISPDIKITQTKSTRDQETTIEITSHDITDLKMILEDIGYDNRDGLITKIRSALRDLKNR